MSIQRYKNDNIKADKSSEPIGVYGNTDSIRRQLVSRIMKIDNMEALKAVFDFLDDNALFVDDSFEKEWNRSLSIEKFKMQCNAKLKEIYE